MGAALADSKGFFWTTLYDTNGQRPGLRSGDAVAIYRNGTLAANATLRSIIGQINVVNNVVSGIIGGGGHPISVTVYAPAGEPGPTSYRQHVRSDAIGYFMADFSAIWDFAAWDEAVVAYVEGGLEVHRHVYPDSSLAVFPSPLNVLIGYAPPGSVVTATVYLPDMTFKAASAFYAHPTSGQYMQLAPADLLEGDIVVVELANGKALRRRVDLLSMNVDAVNNRITGSALPGATVRGVTDALTAQGWRRIQTRATAHPATGFYSLPFDGFADIVPGRWVAVFVADMEGDDLAVYGLAPSVEVDQTWNQIYGYGASSPGPQNEGQQVTLTLYSAAQGMTFTYFKGLDWGAQYRFDESDGLPDIGPGDIITVSSGAWQGVVQVRTMTVQHDVASDQFSGTVEPPTNLVELSGSRRASYLYPAGGGFALLTTAGTSWSATPAGFDVRNGVAYEVAHRTAGEYMERLYRETDWFGAFLFKSVVQATLAPPGSAYTITLYDRYGGVKAQLMGTSQEPIGRVERVFGETGQLIALGDRLRVQAETGFNQTLVIPQLAVMGNADDDIVYGQGPANALLFVTVEGQGQGFVPSDSSGRFAVAVGQLQNAWGDGDLKWGDNVWVEYHDENGNWVFDWVSWPWLRVNYAHDWVGVNYPVGHTVWFTVTDSSGTVKATAAIRTVYGGGWGGGGYQTQRQDWSPVPPDIEPGDWVYATVDDGYYMEVRVGRISGVLDVNNDSITGYVYAPWFTQTLDVEAHVWECCGAPSKGSTAAPDGNAPYFCQWDPRTEWDLLPGQKVAVMYIEPDHDRVINVFREPAPQLRVEKWREGHEAAPGGPVVFFMRYVNEGDGPATTILLTDTLPANTTYITDSSGFPANVRPGVVTWILGPLAAGEERQFQVVLRNTAQPSDTLRNQVDIYTPYDNQPWNDHAEAEVHVGEGQPDLYIKHWPNPGDPAPGQTFLYEIDYGNSGPVASGPVLLTATLPAGTTVVSWYSENEYSLWRQVRLSGNQLVLAAAAIPGYWGDDIRLRLRVNDTVPIKTQLTNVVEIHTAGDTNPDNNRHVCNDAWVGRPRWNAGINKDWDSGQLVPGGWVRYELSFGNSGNMATRIWVTDSLPVGTTFHDSWLHLGKRRSIHRLPDYLDGQSAVWDLGVLEPGEKYGLGLELLINRTVMPGTVLTNCAEIALAGNDEYPYDDTACVENAVSGPGPNLRMDKEYWWEWEGQLRYVIWLWNVGTELLQNVVLTDTYPFSTTWRGDWWWWGWGDVRVAHDEPNRQLAFWVERIEPGERVELNFWVDLDDGIVGKQGLAFTNTVEAPVSGDVSPVDNYDEVLAFTGPDVYVEKWLSGGLPRPGEVVTFTVKFGNRNKWPWHSDKGRNSHITDILPPQLQFIRAIGSWNPQEVWEPEFIVGNNIIWEWGPMWADSAWYFDLAVRIADEVQGGDVITNVIQAYSDSPRDVELFRDNNVFHLPVTILNPKFEVSKVYAGNQVAGTVVTYTLTVTNTGTEAGTNAVLSDRLPAGITYGGSDGVFAGQFITWTFASIPAGGTATAWFSATLPCEARLHVLNDDYAVRRSDEGVGSPPGAAVGFNVRLPTLDVHFTQSAMSVAPGSTVFFTDTSTTDGTPIVAWEWDWGDGSASAFTHHASHAYSSVGTYTVTLTVTDTCGYVGAGAGSVTVKPYGVFLPVVMKAQH